MKEKIKKDEMYVVNQPKHLLLSVVLMDYEKYPLPDDIHNGLCELSEISDMIFIFSDNHFDNSGIHKSKITSLYQGCAFIDSSGKLPRTFFKALLYDKEIFSKHLGTSIIRCQDLSNCLDIKNKLFENLIKVNQSKVNKPIFNIYRLSSNDIYNFYKDENDTKETHTYHSTLNMFENSLLYLLSLKDYDKFEVDCRYCTWGSKSRVIYFRNTTINLFLEQMIKSEEDFYKFIDTFTDKDIRFLFAGLSKKFGIGCINHNIEDLDIDKI